MKTTAENHLLMLAKEYVLHTDSHVFLTGRAGTGKTTFLRELFSKSVKRMIITAPTGVAAINAGGVTLHSFFQLPFGPFIPGGHAHDRMQKRMFRFSKEKKQIIRGLDLLVIDEISMVRADLLDAVDAVLKQHRRNTLPFGGVQLLMIGDLHQLAPVARRDEWSVLSDHYNTAYFFSSHALADTRMVTIELRHVYRQSDETFLDVLNRVRSSRMDTRVMETLNQRYVRGFTPEDNSGYITLTTHNAAADGINKDRLAALEGNPCFLEAEVSGEFPEYNFPTFDILELKKGAQVMFLRNDTSVQKKYYNGKIGRISRISEEEIGIICPDEPEEIVLKPVEWENIKYTIEPETKEIREEIIGRFKQFPLKPAWAITIHKSQGLTFDKAVIDVQNAFSHGQVYVALSRCRTLEGLVLSSPVPDRGIGADQAVLDFLEEQKTNMPDEDSLQRAKISFQQKLILECFDFNTLQNRLNYTARLLLGNRTRIQVSGLPDIQAVQASAGEEIFAVAEKFRRQLQSLFKEDVLPEADDKIIERTSKASKWFHEKFSFIFDDIMEKLFVETDNKELQKQLDNAVENLRREIRIKHAGVKSCHNGFFLAGCLACISKEKLDIPEKKRRKEKVPVYTESDISHPRLFESLRQWRLDQAKEQNVPAYVILQQKALIQVAVNLPENEKELGKLKGIGKATLKKYGREILDRVADYRSQIESKKSAAL